MIVNALFYGIVLICNCMLISASILTPMKEEGPLRVYNGRQNGLEYILKRSEDPQEEPDSKERRSKIGSSFIRFGRNYFERSPKNMDYTMLNKNDLKSQRDTRGKSDNIIRFGRSDLKTSHKADHAYQRHNLKFVRYGRNNVQQAPAELDVSLICPNVLVEDDARNNRELQILLSKLMIICNGLDYDENDESTRGSNMEFTDDNGDSV